MARKARTEQAPREIPCLDVGVLEFDGTKLSAEEQTRGREPPTECRRVSFLRQRARRALRSGTQSVGEIQKPVWEFSSDAAFPHYIERTPEAPLSDKVFPIEMNGEELKMLALQFAVLAPLEPGEEWPYRNPA